MDRPLFIIQNLFPFPLSCDFYDAINQNYTNIIFEYVALSSQFSIKDLYGCS